MIINGDYLFIYIYTVINFGDPAPASTSRSFIYVGLNKVARHRMSMKYVVIFSDMFDIEVS